MVILLFMALNKAIGTCVIGISGLGGLATGAYCAKMMVIHAPKYNPDAIQLRNKFEFEEGNKRLFRKYGIISVASVLSGPIISSGIYFSLANMKTFKPAGGAIVMLPALIISSGPFLIYSFSSLSAFLWVINKRITFLAVNN